MRSVKNGIPSGLNSPESIFFFLLINVIAIFLFAPYQGSKIYGTRTELMHLADYYALTKEQLFYEIFSSLERIDTISNAMELCGFGKHKKRTGYAGRPFKTADYITIGAVILLVSLPW